MKIALGSDHAGYQLKRQVMDHLHKQGIECEDFGAPKSTVERLIKERADFAASKLASEVGDFGRIGEKMQKGRGSYT